MKILNFRSDPISNTILIIWISVFAVAIGDLATIKQVSGNGVVVGKKHRVGRKSEVWEVSLAQSTYVDRCFLTKQQFDSVSIGDSVTYTAPKGGITGIVTAGNVERILADSHSISAPPLDGRAPPAK